MYGIHTVDRACKSMLPFQEAIGYSLKSLASTTSLSMSSYGGDLWTKWVPLYDTSCRYAIASFGLYAQALLMLEWANQIMIMSNDMYVAKTAIDGRGLWKW